MAPQVKDILLYNKILLSIKEHRVLLADCYKGDDKETRHACVLLLDIDEDNHRPKAKVVALLVQDSDCYVECDPLFSGHDKE